MITVEDFRYVMNMEKAQELRASGIPPEEALRLAGVEFKTSRRGPGRPFTHEEAVEHFRQDDLRNEQVRRQVEREKMTRLLKPFFLVLQIILAIVLAVLVAHVWHLV